MFRGDVWYLVESTSMGFRCRPNKYSRNLLFSIISPCKRPFSNVGGIDGGWHIEGTCSVLWMHNIQQRSDGCIYFAFASWESCIMLFQLEMWCVELGCDLVIIHMIATCAFISNLECKQRPVSEDTPSNASLTDLKYTLCLTLIYYIRAQSDSNGSN